MSAACAAISTLGVERVIPTTGFFPGHAAAESLGLPVLAAHCTPAGLSRFQASCLCPEKRG